MKFKERKRKHDDAHRPIKVRGRGTPRAAKLVPMTDEYPPCAMCQGPNDMGEVCAKCADENDPLGTDLEASGGWAVQDGRDRG